MFNSILLAIDDSPSGPATVSFAIAMANSSGAAVHVVHMNEFVVGGRGHTVETRAEAAQVVAEAVAEFEAAGVAATGEVGLSNCFAVAHHIVEVAGETLADVIVVGSRRRSRWGGLRGKGVRERITELTSLPVMTTPPPLRLGRDRWIAPRTLVVAPSSEPASVPTGALDQRGRRFRMSTTIDGPAARNTRRSA